MVASLIATNQGLKAERDATTLDNEALVAERTRLKADALEFRQRRKRNFFKARGAYGHRSLKEANEFAHGGKVLTDAFILQDDSEMTVKDQEIFERWYGLDHAQVLKYSTLCIEILRHNTDCSDLTFGYDQFLRALDKYGDKAMDGFVIPEVAHAFSSLIEIVRKELPSPTIAEPCSPSGRALHRFFDVYNNKYFPRKR